MSELPPGVRELTAKEQRQCRATVNKFKKGKRFTLDEWAHKARVGLSTAYDWLGWAIYRGWVKHDGMLHWSRT